MLTERLELIEYEIEKVTKELISLYSQIAIKGNASPANEALYHTKKSALASLTHARIEIMALLEQNPNT